MQEEIQDFFDRTTAMRHRPNKLERIHYTRANRVVLNDEDNEKIYSKKKKLSDR